MTSAPRKALPTPIPITPTTIGGTPTHPGIPSLAAHPPASSPLASKTCIITGCNSPLGIGRATAYLFASQGCRGLILSDFQTTNLSAWKTEIEKLYPGVEVVVVKVDAGEEEDVRGVVKEAETRWGRLDVFFANAGVNGTMKRVFDDVDGSGEKEFMAVMRVNALSVFLAIKHASCLMLKNNPPSGSIISTASVAGLRSNAGPTDYSASKAAVISITQTSAYQLSGTGIRVNCICPGIIETGMTTAMYEQARKKGTEGKIGQLNPMRRGGLADEVARVVGFLAGDGSSYVDGQAWAVDGGLSAGLPFVPGKLA